MASIENEMTPTRQSIPRLSGSTLPRMTTEYRATQPQVEDLTAVPGHTGSPTQQYLQHVGKVHAVAVVGDLEQFGTVCGHALARPTRPPVLRRARRGAVP
jgi:hypothetical protein